MVCTIIYDINREDVLCEQLTLSTIPFRGAPRESSIGRIELYDLLNGGAGRGKG